jgi:multidrug efflux pump
MGIVIFSGLCIGTVFTLFVVPMFYTLIAKPEPREIAEREASPAPAE